MDERPNGIDDRGKGAVSRRSVLRGIAVGPVAGVLAQVGTAEAATGATSEGENVMTPGTTRTDDGVTLAYRVRGDGPRTLLFMHGWGGSGAYFDETLRYLNFSGLRAVTFDFRGHGASEVTEEGYSLERFVRDTFVVADAVGADTFVPIGYSMSGRFAQYLSVLEPQRVSGQVLVAGWPSGEVPLPEEVIQDWIGRAGNRARLIELERQFITRPVADAVVERWADDAVKIPRAVLEATLRMTVEGSFADRAAALRTPTVVVGGLHDPVCTPDFLRQGVKDPLATAGARLVLLDCNHDVPIEQPRELAALIEAFVAGRG